jgi:hypothetical protein
MNLSVGLSLDPHNGLIKFWKERFCLDLQYFHTFIFKNGTVQEQSSQTINALLIY